MQNQSDDVEGKSGEPKSPVTSDEAARCAGNLVSVGGVSLHVGEIGVVTKTSVDGDMTATPRSSGVDATAGMSFSSGSSGGYGWRCADGQVDMFGESASREVSQTCNGPRRPARMQHQPLVFGNQRQSKKTKTFPRAACLQPRGSLVPSIRIAPLPKRSRWRRWRYQRVSLGTKLEPHRPMLRQSSHSPIDQNFHTPAAPQPNNRLHVPACLVCGISNDLECS